MIKAESSRIFRKKLDLLEQGFLLALYVWFVTRLWPDSLAKGTTQVFLLLVSEGLIIALLLIRKPTENISTRFSEWLIAFSCSFLPLLVRKGEDPLLLYPSTGLMIFGMLAHTGAKLSLFRSFGVVPANRGVQTKGLYSIVRHPMYAGYLFTHLGFLLSTPSLWNFSIYSFTWALMVFRILAEEKVLLLAPEYKNYAQQVQYRFIPGVF